jgi:hypothetical protein
LFEFTGGSKWWQNNLKPASNYLVTPKEYLEYEEAFLE